MKKSFKLTSYIMVFMLIVIMMTVTVSADDSNVTYTGNSGQFIFAPGSDYSPTDLFPDFKSVMPGDTISQKIVINNKADNKVKVTIYLRSNGETADSDDDFLKQLHLTVKAEDSTELFDAAADQSGDLTEWTELGTLYAGGYITLDLSLTVPTTLDNDYQNQVGKIKWEFMAVETPDEEKPATGDHSNAVIWIVIGALCVCIIIVILILLNKKKKNKDED